MQSLVSAPDYEPVTERVDFFRQAANAPGETRMVEVTAGPKGGVRPPRPGLNFVQDVPKPLRRRTSRREAIRAGVRKKRRCSLRCKKPSGYSRITLMLIVFWQ